MPCTWLLWGLFRAFGRETNVPYLAMAGKCGSNILLTGDGIRGKVVKIQWVWLLDFLSIPRAAKQDSMVLAWWHQCLALVNPGREELSGSVLLATHASGCPTAVPSSSTSGSFGCPQWGSAPSAANWLHAWVSSSWKCRCPGEEERGSLGCVQVRM